MRDTPRTDAYIEMLEGAKADVFSALPALQDWARLLERENANLRASLAERQRDVNALMEDIRKGDDMLMAWFKAASPYATPGSLEEGLKKLRNEVIEEVINAIESAPLTYAGPDPHVVSDLRYLMVRSIRDLKNFQPDVPIDSTVKPSAWD